MDSVWYQSARRRHYLINSVKKREGTIEEMQFELHQRQYFVECPYCEAKFAPGLMSLAKHWTECPKNPTLLKILVGKTTLDDSIETIIKLKQMSDSLSYVEQKSPLIEETKRTVKF